MERVPGIKRTVLQLGGSETQQWRTGGSAGNGKQLKALNFEFNLVHIHPEACPSTQPGWSWKSWGRSGFLWRAPGCLNEGHYGALISLNREQMLELPAKSKWGCGDELPTLTPPPIDESHPTTTKSTMTGKYKVCDVPDWMAMTGELKGCSERPSLLEWERIAPEVLRGKTILISKLMEIAAGHSWNIWKVPSSCYY